MTQYTYYPGNNNGEAYVATKRNRVKVYPGNNVYLKDGQEFEIELFNPTQNTKLVKISIDGKPISSTGLVLKPGQRYFLERYIDEARKFLFETYVVESGNAAVENAIKQNGLVEISFYDEYTPVSYANTFDLNVYKQKLRYRKSLSDYNNNYRQTFFLNSQNISNSKDNNNFLRSANLMSFSNGDVSASYNTDSLSNASANLFEQEETKETGRVDKGSCSQQSFGTYSGSFQSWPSNTVKIKILPFSEKPLEVKDLADYCTGCGRRRKKNDKFCGGCGNEF